MDQHEIARTTPYATSLPAAFHSAQAGSKMEEVALKNTFLVTSEVKTVAAVQKTARDTVYEYFADAPELIEVARCESRFRHFDANGRVLRGDINQSDIGVMQVNIYYHEETAKKLGLDLYSIEGNMAYARSLYEREGLTPWNSSSKCWRSKVTEIALK